MRKSAWILFLVVAFLAAGTALAEEVIHFKNGTSMEIRSHQVKEDMIHVMLGSNGIMAFPVSMVERIERSGSDVAVWSTAEIDQLNAKDKGSPMIAASSSDPSLGKDRGGHPKLKRDPTVRPQNEDGPEMFGVDDSGAAWMKPQAGSPHKRKQQMKAYGHQSLLQRRTEKGNGAVTTRGGRKIIASGSSSPSSQSKSAEKKASATSFGQRGGSTGSPKKKKETEDQDSGSESDN